MKRVLMAAVAMLALAQGARAQPMVISAARMVDVLAGKMVVDAVVVVEGGRIVAAGSRATIRLPDAATRLDLGDMTLLPGLIDMHVHLDSVPEYGGYTGLQFSDAFFAVAAAANARTMLEHGFTTVRNIGSTGYNDVGLREAIDAGLVPGPRIVSAIAPGRLADVIAVRGDPLTDVRALETVAVVVKGGTVARDVR